MTRRLWVAVLMVVISAVLGFAVLRQTPYAAQEGFSMTDEFAVRDLFPGGRMTPDRTYYIRCENGRQTRYYPAPDYSRVETPRACWR